MPVFPEVGSMMTECPGISRLERSVWVIIRRAMRSLMDPPAEKNSTLATAVLSIWRPTERQNRYRRWGETGYTIVLTNIAFDAPSLCQPTQVDQRGMAHGVGGGIEYARPVVFGVHRVCIALVYDLVRYVFLDNRLET
jgi:hypothetical protein